ncbi:MAG: hypothetical protein VKJ46_14865 [Leptolyngbyaceae bacterium]|nr:hypothetical protein [Leptolyngbyaceae bacterium]
MILPVRSPRPSQKTSWGQCLSDLTIPVHLILTVLDGQAICFLPRTLNRSMSDRPY